MVENISVFQEKQPNALAKIPQMTPRDRECCICSYNKCIKRAQTIDNQASKICGVHNEVGNYIDTIIEEVNI